MEGTLAGGVTGTAEGYTVGGTERERERERDKNSNTGEKVIYTIIKVGTNQRHSPNTDIFLMAQFT